ncbi:hypothetical protein D3C81_1957260 [compost metagenome]
MAILGIDQVHRPAGRTVIGHQGQQLSVLEVLLDQGVGHHHDAHAGARRLMQSGGTVDQHRPADPHADFAIGTGQAPFLLHRLPVIPGRIGKGQAVVVSQVFRRLRCAATGQIVR